MNFMKNTNEQTTLVQAEEEAKALGFPSAQAAREHAAWLSKNGTTEYRAWLAQINQWSDDQPHVESSNAADLEQLQQEDAMFQWLATGSMADEPTDADGVQTMTTGFWGKGEY